MLVEAGPRILPTFSEKLGERAHKDLGALGVLGAPTAGPKTPAAGTTTGTRGTEADRLGPSWT